MGEDSPRSENEGLGGEPWAGAEENLCLLNLTFCPGIQVVEIPGSFLDIEVSWPPHRK